MKKLFSLLLVFLALPLVLSACVSLSEADKHFNAGLEYQEQGRLQEAIAEYDEAIRLNPLDAVAYNNRGNAYNDLGQLERAIADYDEAIRLNPQFAEAYSNRGITYYNLGQLEQAIEDYDETIRLNPEYADAYLSITQEVFAWGKAGAAAAIMLLIFALFLLDHHVKTLQSVALYRAAGLEKLLGLVPESTGEGSADVTHQSLSGLRQGVAHSWQMTHGGTPIYFLFLAVTGGLGITAVLTTRPGEPFLGALIAVAFVCIVLCGVIPAYDRWATGKMEDLLTQKGIRRQLAGVFTQLGKILQEKDKKTRQ